MMKGRLTTKKREGRREGERNGAAPQRVAASYVPGVASLFTGRRARTRSRRQSLFDYRFRFMLAVILCICFLGGGCFESEKGQEFYGKVVVPQAREFRWSDGGLPQVFDPARAAAPPDTDAVRALFEGLTDYDPVTLKPLPAIASRWESADEGRRWTFYLRKDAFWSNGDPVTADDFVRSWKRTLRLREQAPHARLLANIEGASEFADTVVASLQPAVPAQQTEVQPSPTPGEQSDSGAQQQQQAPPVALPPKFGVEAPDAYTLKVTLLRPDRNFPALVAHPVFRPFHELSPGGDLSANEDLRENSVQENLSTSIVTNGPFRLSGLGSDGVVLEKAENYWATSSVELERVRFVPAKSAEDALTAYKAGEVDAVTNAAFEPLALKLLAPYNDFRRSTFAALTYYSFNVAHAPFSDRRVREALAISLDLERLSADTMGGATQAAKKFLPLEDGDEEDTAQMEGKTVAGVRNDEGKDAKTEAAPPLRQNIERARRLLAEAGFPGGQNFPTIRLLVNRSEQQRLVAVAVSRMWRNALGVQTHVEVRNWEDYEAMIKAGEYDVARRSVVLQTTDEETNMLALFGEQPRADTLPREVAESSPQADASATPKDDDAGLTPDRRSPDAQALPAFLTEAQALKELPAVPLYFASSYALVKPYVRGFDSNLLDAPSLKHVSINMNWKPPAQNETISIVRNNVR